MDLGGRKQKEKPLRSGENQGGFGTRGVNQMVSNWREKTKGKTAP